MTKQILVCGNDGLTHRIIEGLIIENQPVKLMVPKENKTETSVRTIEQVTLLNIPIEYGEFNSSKDLLKAAENVNVIALLMDDDIKNLEVALMISENLPEMPIIVRLFRSELAQEFSILVPNAHVLSASEIAAPVFYELALIGKEPESSHPNYFIRKQRKISRLTKTVCTTLKSVAAGLIAMWMVLILIGTLLIHKFMDLSWSEAGFYAFTAGNGEVAVPDGTPGIVKAYIALMLLGGLITVSTLSMRAQEHFTNRAAKRTLGLMPLPEYGHIIVGGLGKLGSRVLTMLVENKFTVIGVDENENSAGIKIAKRLGVPYRIGSVTDLGLLEELNLPACRTALIITDHDMTNLEGALLAGRLGAEHVIMRMFDPERADRIDQTTSIDITRSVAGIAAPKFVETILQVVNLPTS